ncbi:MAG: RNA-directed DNA polymerase [Candidatus Nomurabacteria bacterium]|nr:RNA-directed DNA polymerase [Candidatus Nomurabacteria bacterium]
MNLIQWRSETLSLAKKIIFHDPTKNYFYKGDPKKKALIPPHKSLFCVKNKGLPIGNLTSQFFANVYLNELDHFVIDTLGIERYIRYVDDFVIVHEDKNRLTSVTKSIDIFLKEILGLRIHPKKIYLQEIYKGIDFLGYFIKPSHILVRQRVVRRFKNRLYQNIDEEGFLLVSNIPMIQSYLGHFGHANTFNLKKKLAR